MTTCHETAPDAATAQRMTAAFTRAAADLGAQVFDHPVKAWGWRGRTLSGPLTLDGDTVWMRLASTRPNAIAETFWRGNHAARMLPPEIPRPTLLSFAEYIQDGYAYARELYAFTANGALSATPATDALPHVEERWWTELRASLDVLSKVSTARMTIRPQFLERIMPETLGPDAPTDPGSPWVTAHGDLHWANLAGPRLTIFDWEGWGLAPPGYDAATLLCHSLATPAGAAEVAKKMAAHLTGPGGAFAIAAVFAEHLWKLRDAPNDPHARAMRIYLAERI